nr:hypothetical transcript [Hymenolepis microstoma]
MHRVYQTFSLATHKPIDPAITSPYLAKKTKDLLMPLGLVTDAPQTTTYTKVAQKIPSLKAMLLMYHEFGQLEGKHHHIIMAKVHQSKELVKDVLKCGYVKFGEGLKFEEIRDMAGEFMTIFIAVDAAIKKEASSFPTNIIVTSILPYFSCSSFASSFSPTSTHFPLSSALLPPHRPPSSTQLPLNAAVHSGYTSPRLIQRVSTLESSAKDARMDLIFYF